MKPGAIEADKAFTRLVRERQRSVFALAFGKLGNSHDAEDVMQEVFVEAFRNIHKLKNPEKAAGWLFTATLNRCKDHWRKKSRRERREMKFAKLADSSAANQSGNGPADAMLEAVGRLRENLRTVVMLKHFSELTYAEISEITGLSSTTIDGRLRTAKKELKQTLTKRGEGVS